MSIRWLLAFFLMVSAAHAQVKPIIFERETIRIESPAARTTTAKDEKAKPEPVPHPPLTFDIEVRPEDALRLEYIHTMNSLTDTSGVMIAFTAPSVIGLPALQVPTAVDALFVMDNGTVVQILPEVVLADMTQEIVAHAPVKAFLFLKAGTVKAKGIRPQDRVYGNKFTPPPPVLE